MLKRCLPRPVEVSCEYFKTAAFNHSATSPSPRKSLFYLTLLPIEISHEVTSAWPFSHICFSTGPCRKQAIGEPIDSVPSLSFHRVGNTSTA
jgi:hypothetical protein